MKKILKASFILSFSTAATLFTGIIKNKLLAVCLGPVGLGILAQVNSFLNITNTVSSLGLTQGVTKYVAENENFNNARVRFKHILYSANLIVLFVSLPLCVLTILFSKKLSVLLLNNGSLYIFFIIIAAVIPLQAAGQIFMSFVQGLKAVKAISAMSIFISIAGLSIFFPLVLFFHLNGAVVGILIFAIVSFFAFWYLAKRLIRSASSSEEERVAGTLYIKDLLNFGYLRLIQTSIYPLTILVIRSLIIKRLGLFSNGLYEAALAYSFMFVPLINNILWSYSYPNYCSADNNHTLLKEVNQFLRVSLLIAVPIITAIMLSRNFLIRLLFSAEFLPAVEIIAIQLMGDFLKVLIWPFNVVLMAKDRMKTAIAFEIVWNVLFLLLSLYAIKAYQLKGVFVAQNLSLFLLFILTYIHTNNKFKLKVNRANLFLILASILIIFTASLFKPIF